MRREPYRLPLSKCKNNAAEAAERRSRWKR